MCQLRKVGRSQTRKLGVFSDESVLLQSDKRITKERVQEQARLALSKFQQNKVNFVILPRGESFKQYVYMKINLSYLDRNSLTCVKISKSGSQLKSHFLLPKYSQDKPVGPTSLRSGFFKEFFELQLELKLSQSIQVLIFYTDPFSPQHNLNAYDFEFVQ